jgi:hypothetical protein
MVEGQSGGETLFNEFVNRVDEMIHLAVNSAGDNTPPGSPSDGESYLIGGSPTGAWSANADDLALYFSGWIFITPKEGMRMYIRDTDVFQVYDGSNWLTIPVKDSADFTLKTVTNGITASTTQTQGQMPLTAELNEVTVCANANDVVTLPAAAPGRRCVVINDGANTLQVFPASGDEIHNLGVDASTTVAAGFTLDVDAYNATNWK